MKAEKKTAPAIPGPMQEAFAKANIVVVKDTQMAISPKERGISVEEDQKLFAQQQMLREEYVEEPAHVPAIVKDPLGTGALLHPRRRIFDYMSHQPPLEINQIGTLIQALGEGYTNNAIYAEVRSMQEDGFFTNSLITASNITLKLKDDAPVPEVEYTYFPRPSRVVTLKQPLIKKPPMPHAERLKRARAQREHLILIGVLDKKGRKTPETLAAEKRVKEAKAKKREADAKERKRLKEEEAMKKGTKKAAAKQPATTKRKYTRKAAEPVAKRKYVRRTPPATAPLPTIPQTAAPTTAQGPDPQAMEQLKNQLRNSKSSEILEALKQSLSFADLTELKERINGLLK